MINNSTKKKKKKNITISFSNIVINGDRKSYEKNHNYYSFPWLLIITIITISILFILRYYYSSLNYVHSYFDRNKSNNISAVIFDYSDPNKYFDKTIINAKLKIVYVYLMNENNCNKYPYHNSLDYIFHSLENVAKNNYYYNNSYDIIFASNFKECIEFEELFDEMNNKTFNKIIKFDSTLVNHKSKKTQKFTELGNLFFQKDKKGELWLNAALRFFIIEDIMTLKGYEEILHIETDNLIYGPIDKLILKLRDNNYNIIATPLTGDLSHLTASILYINKLSIFKLFTNMLMEITISNSTANQGYITWLKSFSFFRRKGSNSIYQDSDGMGVKPFSINEMTFMAYFHHLYPKILNLFPVVPSHNNYNYYKKHGEHLKIINISDFSSNGNKVVQTGLGIWDANSWGQFIGGTSTKKGKDVGFIDMTHISGQAIYFGNCNVTMSCFNTHNYFGHNFFDTSYSLNNCMTVPVVICNNNNTIITNPLWNLHVHSKHVNNFLSIPCNC